MSESLLELQNISYHYREGNWQLNDVSLKIKSHKVLGIIGPNGAGKSTLLKIAAGALKAQQGNIILADNNIRRLSRREIARFLGYLPQNVNSTYDYTVQEVVAMGRFAHLGRMGFLQKSDLDIIENCLQATETAAFGRRTLSHLSGGEKQRVLLASVLAQEPKILLLDEPTTGLDLHHQTEFFELLTSQARQGIAVAVVTHDLNLAGQFCDELLLMQNGRKFIQANVADVLRPEIIKEIYHENLYIGRHPQSDMPIVLPVRKNII